MPDLSPSADPDASAPALDTSVIPLGERALRGVLDHVVAVGDEAEATYLEVKSFLDMNSKATAAKIAKFLLGAANRRPGEAARHFHGYAVLVIGAAKNSASGVPRGTEAHELEDRLRPYLGPQFPAFEFGRIGINAGHEVLFVIAQPPEDGQTIFPCHKSYQGADRRDSMEDGAIYVRGTSNTRPARSGEVLSLVERSRRGGKPPINLELQLLGTIGRVDRVDEVLETLRGFEEERFSEQPTLANDAFASTSIRLASSIFGGPLSAEDREQALAEWRSKKAEHIAKGRDHFLGAAMTGAGVQVVSRDRFVAKPHLILTFRNCEVLDYLDPDDADFEKVIEPVLQSNNGPLFRQSLDYSSLRPLPREYPVTWCTLGKNAEVVLTPESFRPNVPWTSDQDDYVIIARNPQASSVEVSWQLTEDGSDSVTSGELRVPTGPLVDAADLFQSVFLSTD
ncbi:hypothetical protein ACGFYE_41625 [Streptomyces zaomyceticus]|uniref:hypothetical protein n=1 Tax=Streptomyces zaomyceticus TaxID=68286 RepID=UPI00371B47CC